MSRMLTSAAELAASFEAGNPPLVLDCRVRLGEPEAGRRLWEAGHIPTSQHLDLDSDLAGPPGEGGRHPLPTPDAFTAVVQRLGITPGTPVVVVDDMGGQLAAARAWWMLFCWAGHPDVRVLDGGLRAWQDAGGSLVLGRESVPGPGTWQPRFDDASWVDARAVLAGNDLKVDARSLERFRGEVEPIDPVAGHIPGAQCRPSAANLDDDGQFKSAEQLDDELPDADAVIAYCGSGVTACHNILAYAIAGRPLPRLYVGSWSDWIRKESHPVARG